MKQLILMVGPPGAGKSTAALGELNDSVYINQDSQGKEEHKKLFLEAVKAGSDIIVDRMNFSKEQRARYIVPAREAGYTVSIHVLHESKETCFQRCMARENHETIKDEHSAKQALNLFFTKYEKPTKDEADEVKFHYPPGEKPEVVICDLDGTLCNLDHRLHFVKQERKDWKGFFKALEGDSVNAWCKELIVSQAINYKRPTILCSGRPDSYERETRAWLKKNHIQYEHLFMRPRNDFRADSIAKEIILDFEILTRFTPYLIIDDRKNVVEMWRQRGYTCLQCAEGNF